MPTRELISDVLSFGQAAGTTMGFEKYVSIEYVPCAFDHG